MKGRLNSTIAMLAFVNILALFGVLALAYMAGKGGETGNLMLLGAGAVALLVGIGVWAALGSKVSTPLKQLTEFSERVGAGDYKTRIAIDSPDDFGFIAENLNRANERAGRAVFNQEAQENLQRSVTDFLTIVSQIARGDLTLRGKVTNDALGNVVDSVNYMLDNFTKVLERVR